MVEPVALQDNLGKTPAAEKITQIEKAQPELAQRDTAIVGRRKAVEQQSKPHPTDKTDEVIIHRDQEQRKNRQQHPEHDKLKDQQEKPAPETAKTAQPPKPESAQHLDLRV